MLKPFLTTRFAASCLIYLFSAVVWLGAFFALPILDNFGTAGAPVVAVSDIGRTFEESNEAAVLSEFQYVGDPFVPDEKSSYMYQLLVSADTDVSDISGLAEEDYLLVETDREGELGAIRDYLKDGRAGFWLKAPCDQEDTEPELTQEDGNQDEFVEHFKAEFPNLDHRKIESFHIGKPLPFWMYAFFGSFGLFSLAMIPVTMFTTYRKYLKDLLWLDKIDDDRTAHYQANPHAMRLIGAHQFLGTQGLYERPIDYEFDVPAGKEVKRPRLKQFSWVLGVGIIVAALGGLAQCINLSIVGLSNKNVSGRQEISVPESKQITEHPFYQYHDHVLNELGLVKLGHFRALGGNIDLFRTIYLSPSGNVLVEIGDQGGFQYFTIESVTNNGKFLETHSLTKPRMVNFEKLTSPKNVFRDSWSGHRARRLRTAS